MDLHESAGALGAKTLDAHRAIRSIMEEFEAVDWYQQRAEATDDVELRRVLEHNRDEEKEHASMTIEWLRRHDPALDRHLRTYLFTDAPITEVEARAEADDGDAPTTTDLGIGSLRKEQEA